MDTAVRDCEVLFDTSVGGRLDAGWDQGVLCQRTRTTTAGPMVYVDCYPMWSRAAKAAARAEAQKESHRKAQEKQNRKRAERRLVTLVNANFGAGDLVMTLEYPLHEQPGTDEQAAKDVRNYLSRIRYRRNKRGLSALKYVYVTERTESAQYGTRWHHHILMSGDGMERDEAEEIWAKRHKGFANSRRAQPNEKHLTGLACYLLKNKRDRKPGKDGKNPQIKTTHRAFNASRNLKEPKETTADKKISIRKAGKVAETVEDMTRAREVFARLYPDCELLEVRAYKSPWAAGVYIRAELRKKERRN